MPQVTVFDMTGKSVGEMTLSDAIFGIEPNTSVMHAAVVNYLANQRQGTQSTLTRSEVSGGGRKPWKQKGTGRARQGSTRAPQWTHGGIALGPKPRDYSYTLPKKVKRLALKSAFSTKVADNDLIVVDNIAVFSCNGEVAEICRYTRIDAQTVQRRLNTDDVLRYIDKGPCSRSGQPAVLCLAEPRSILSGDHL